MTTYGRMTLERFLELPEEKPALEFEPDGTVTQKMSPTAQHIVLQKALAELIDHFGGGRVVQAFPELRTIFAGASYVPDVAVYLWDRIPRDASGDISNDVCYEPPDIAFEVVSPGQRVSSLLRKCAWYLENGVRVAVIVDTEDRTVLVLRKDQPLRISRGDDQIDLSDVLPGFELTAGQLFRRLRL
jgi:Uma2 family endonuclease